MWVKNLETGVLHRGHVGGPGRGRCFTWNFERKVIFLFIKRYCLLGNQRDMCKKALEMGNTLIRVSLGT
jgi:hypothetical protein